MSSKKKVRIFLREHSELLNEPTSNAVAVLADEFSDLNVRTLERYFQEFRKGAEVEGPSATSNKQEVFRILALHPDIVGMPTKEARAELKPLLPSWVEVSNSTIERYIQAYRKTEEVEDNTLSDGDFWYRHDPTTQSYTICAGKCQWADIPENEVQDWVQSYVYMGEKKSQSVVARRAAMLGRPLTRKHVRGIFKALGVTKDSLPVAPHILEGSVEDAAERVFEAQIAAVESKVRYDEAERWRKEYETLRKKYNNIEVMAERIVEAMQESEPLDMPPLRFDSAREEYDGCLFISDWHAGQAFHSPLGTFNRDIFKRRVHSLCQETHAILDSQRRPLRSLSIAIGGDMVDGVLPMRPGHHLEQDVWGGEQVSDAANAIAYLIESLWARIDCPVSVYSVAGNHDRAGGDRNHDPKRVIAQWLHQVTSEKLPDEIDWYHTSEEVNQWILGDDTMMLLSHGDNVPKDPKALAEVYCVPGIENYMIMTGHRHTPTYSEARNVSHVQSGSLVGPDPYGGNRFGKVSRPSQVWIEVTPRKRPRAMAIAID